MADGPILSTKTLEMIRLTDSLRVKRDTVLEMHHDFVRDELIYRIETLVAAEHLADDRFLGHETVEWPASTWQMFKQTNQNRWWMRRLVRRRPVRMHKKMVFVTVEVSRYAAYPDADIPVHRLGRPIPFERVKQIR